MQRKCIDYKYCIFYFNDKGAVKKVPDEKKR